MRSRFSRARLRRPKMPEPRCLIANRFCLHFWKSSVRGGAKYLVPDCHGWRVHLLSQMREFLAWEADLSLRCRKGERCSQVDWVLEFVRRRRWVERGEFPRLPRRFNRGGACE